ncbi:MAG: hypothetical protein QXE31_03560 [Candidatus Woesearchaeota archaeon]
MSKHKTMVKGALLNLVVYTIIAFILSALGVPSYIIIALYSMLVWGLFVISYHHYKRSI